MSHTWIIFPNNAAHQHIILTLKRAINFREEKLSTITSRIMVLRLSCEVIMTARSLKLKEQTLHCYLIHHELKIAQKSTAQSYVKTADNNNCQKNRRKQRDCGVPWCRLLCCICARSSRHGAVSPFHSTTISFPGLPSFPLGTCFSWVDGQHHQELQTHLLWYCFHSSNRQACSSLL